MSHEDPYGRQPEQQQGGPGMTPGGQQPSMQWAEGWGGPQQGPGQPSRNPPPHFPPPGPQQAGHIQPGRPSQGPSGMHPPQQLARPRKPSSAMGVIALVAALISCLFTGLYPQLGGGSTVLYLLFAVVALGLGIAAIAGRRGRVFGVFALVLLLIPIGRLILGLVS